MKISSSFLVSSAMIVALTTVAIALILVASNFAIINAQQQQLSDQPTVTDNATTTVAQSTKDSFRVQVPQGWIIYDVNNTGFTLISEVMQGYGILAQLCPEGEGQQQGAARPNTSNSRCQGAQGEVIHIIRYPNLGARLSFTIDDIINDFDDTANTILSYQMQKLREVGYSDIQIVNSTDARIPVDISLSGTNNDDDNDELPPASVAARLVEMTYRTTTASSAPSELKTGYYLLTASDVTPQDLGTMTGYSIFYEGTSSNAAAATIPAAVRQIFGSFELIATPEVAESILAALAAQEELEEQAEETEQPEPEPEEPEPEEPEPEEPEPEEPPGNGTPGFIDLMDLLP
jgi:hypothetical protein